MTFKSLRLPTFGLQLSRKVLHAVECNAVFIEEGSKYKPFAKLVYAECISFVRLHSIISESVCCRMLHVPAFTAWSSPTTIRGIRYRHSRAIGWVSGSLAVKWLHSFRTMLLNCYRMQNLLREFLRYFYPNRDLFALVFAEFPVLAATCTTSVYVVTVKICSTGVWACGPAMLDTFVMLREII